MDGRGVVLFAATPAEAKEAVACVQTINATGSRLPIECWLSVRSPGVKRRLTSAGVVVRYAVADADGLAPATRAELRLHALIHSKFREALVLDPGIVPRVNPEVIFANRAFVGAGVVFPRKGEFRARPGAWKVCGLPLPRHGAGTSAFLIDRERCWSAIPLWRWIVQRTYFFSDYVDGEGGAAQLAFAKLSRAMPVTGPFNRYFRSSRYAR
jgi:hypothetical protein